ncbi:MAG: Sulfate adenylyltransferase subunit 2, partial [uncultured Gemmatimonadetes bacterium]
ASYADQGSRRRGAGARRLVSGLVPQEPPRPARVGGHPRDARGGRAVRAPPPAVFGGQGLHRHGAPGPQGLLAGTLSLSAAAHRHGAQLPRNDRLPRLAGRRDGGRPGRALRPGLHRPGTLRRGNRPRRQPQRAADGDPAGRASRAQGG